jgi:phage FluMu protein Com
MKSDRCVKCNRLMIAMTDRKGRTEVRCVKCDQVDPMETKPRNGPKILWRSRWATLARPPDGSGTKFHNCVHLVMDNKPPYICEIKAFRIIWLGTIAFVFGAMLFGH